MTLTPTSFFFFLQSHLNRKDASVSGFSSLQFQHQLQLQLRQIPSQAHLFGGYFFQVKRTQFAFVMFKGSGILVFEEKIRAFMQNLMLWKSCIDVGNFDCFETQETFIIENQMQLKMIVLFEISSHLSLLKNNF